MKHRRSEAEDNLSALPIRTRCVLRPNGARNVFLEVFCPRRKVTISVDRCERCSRLEAIDTGGECPTVTCEPGSEPGALEPVGALVRSAVLCVRSDLPLGDLDAEGTGSHVIPVVDEEERYLGAIVQGRSSSVPPPRESGVGLLRGHLTAGDAMNFVPAVNESDDIVTAATAMTSSRARCVAVVNDERAVVGLLDDIALLASAARAHATGEDRRTPGPESRPLVRRRRR